MKKGTVPGILVWIVLTVFYLNSCRRDDAPGNFNSDFVAKVTTWLDDQKPKSLAGRSGNINLLKGNLDFRMLWFENSGGRERLLMIPVSERFKALAGMERNVVPVLVLFINSSGNIRNGNLVIYTPPQGGGSKIPVGTFYDIFNTAHPSAAGTFQFLTVGGAPQYQLEYRNGRLVSSGRYQSKPGTAKTNRTLASGCYDWYLVTTWYDIAGNVVDQTYMYLYTSCGDCSSPHYMTLCAGDAGGSNSCCISDETAELFSQVTSQPKADQCGIVTADKLTGLPMKTCTHSWYFNINSLTWYAWKFGSIEQAVEILDGGLWKFKSLAHAATFTDGMIPPCMNSTCQVNSVVPSFSGNTARVDLIYTITNTITCRVAGGFIKKTESASTQWGAK